MSEIREVLKEAYSYQAKHDVDYKNIRSVVTDDNHWQVYVESFAETLPAEAQGAFKVLAENTRKFILENSISTINPYETLMVPILRNFFPRLIAKDLVTVRPIDKPDTFMPFLNVEFVKHTGDRYTAPSIDNDVSGGVTTVGSITVPGNVDLLAAVGLTPNVAHLAKNLVVTKVAEDTGTGPEEVEVNAQPTVDGTFAFNVTFPTSGNTYVFTGKVDWENGIVHLSTDPAPATGVTVTATLTGSISLEENAINSKAEFKIEKIRLVVVDRKISGEWSVEYEQDIRALFDIDFQAELTSVISQQIALDIDREIINTLLQVAETVAPATHREEFDTTPPATFTWGPKQWYENILVKLANVSAAIYDDTQIGAGNVIAANPLDAAILEVLNEFSYNGSSSEGGAVGYKTANLASSKWNVLVSSVVTKGTMPIVHKPDEDMKCIFVHAPYQPVIVMPYPLGPKPTLTIMSRYANVVTRPNGVGRVRIIRP